MTVLELILLLLCLVVLMLLSVWIIGERGKLLLPSTKAFFRQSGMRNFLNGNFFHFYFYARWSKSYIKNALRYYVPRASLKSRRRIGNHYHSKTLTLGQAIKIVNLDQDIDLKDLETVIPYPVARDIVLSAPVQMALYDCPCRESRDNPCQPVRVCMLFGEPIVNFILEHHPNKSHRLTKQEALKILEEEHDRGHVHTAWFKNVCLNRFFAICNCCKCCCGGMISMMKYDVPMIQSSGYVAFIDYSTCLRCGTCVQYCQFEAIKWDGAPEIVWEKCMGCGVCVDKCAHHAISLKADEAKGLPLDFDKLRLTGVTSPEK